MKINLHRFNCIRFQIVGEFSCSEKDDEAIQKLMDQTLNAPDGPEGSNEEETKVAYFASRFKIKNEFHQVFANLKRNEKEGDFSYKCSILNEMGSHELPRLNRKLRSFSSLVEVASLHFGSVNLHVDTVFRYEAGNGFKSRIALPTPLFFTDGEQGITHVESLELSRRESDETLYRIFVFFSEDSDALFHTVLFESVHVLERKSIRELFEKARSISTSLLTKGGVD